MNAKKLLYVIILSLLFLSALPNELVAQQLQRYKLIDLGTFGGPDSFPSPAGSGVPMLNNAGQVTGWADTTTPDPTCFGNDGLCLVTHAFRWERGTLNDLGILPGGNSSAGIAINAGGWVLGASQTGLIDPVQDEAVSAGAPIAPAATSSSKSESIRQHSRNVLGPADKPALSLLTIYSRRLRAGSRGFDRQMVSSIRAEACP